MKIKKINPRDTAVLIDAAYLSKISKHLGQGKYLKYNIHTLAINLAKAYDLWCQDIYYYTAPPFQGSPPTEEQAKRKSSYDKYKREIESKLPTTRVKEGRCQFVNGIYRQKGVDSLITEDLIRISQRKEYRSIIIITADTDFAGIIERIKEEYRMEIILGYYTDKIRGSPFSISNHLWKVCDKKILITPDDFFLEEPHQN